MIRTTESLTGRLLVAAPSIGDPRFERAVILLCAHNADHAMGLTLNRPVGGLTIPDLLARLGVTSDITLPDDLVLFGGPVERERGFVLHTSDYAARPGTVPVADNVALTATRDVLEAMGDAGRRPRRSVLALGYAGWNAGQLESEIQQNAWLVCEPNEALIFGADYDLKWSQALAQIGVSAERLSTLSGRA